MLDLEDVGAICDGRVVPDLLLLPGQGGIVLVEGSYWGAIDGDLHCATVGVADIGQDDLIALEIQRGIVSNCAI